MTKDLNRGITKIEYDLLGNPRKVTLTDNLINPAGLHSNTIRNLGLTNVPTDQIQNYVIIGDGVHLSNIIAPNVIVPGTTNYRTAMWSILFGYSPIWLFINHLANNF